MVDIVYSPLKEIVVHEIVEISRDDLLRERITPAGNMPLYWCDSVLFSFSSLPMTRDVVKEYLSGRIHWAELHYTRMDKYMPVLELNDEHYSGPLKVRVIDTSNSALHKELIKWLRSAKKNNNR